MQTIRTFAMIIAIFASLLSGPFGMAQTTTQPFRKDDGRINPEQHNLEIINLNAPSHIEADRRLDVSVTAADARGIGFVEVQFRDEVRRFEAEGQRIVNFATSFETGRTGFDQLRARAIALDGRTSGPVRTFDISITEAIKTVNRDGSQLPEIDPQYTLDTGGVVSANPGLELDPSPGPWWLKWEKKYENPFD